MAKYYVWLDAGHSKTTPGKRNTVANPDFFEYEFNNDIAVKLKKRLEEHGITVYLTNTTPNGADISLTKRANIANDKWKALGKPSNAIFVSLHGNASTGAWAKARGVEVYHAGNASAKSKELALLLTNQIYNDVKKIDSGFKNRGRKSANFTVIYKALMKAVLIEHGFYDNKEDLALMQNHRNVFVEADCKAICKYFGITYKAPVTSKPVTSTNYIVKVIYEGSDGLNIRKEATTSSTIVGVVYCGEAFTIVEEKNGWGKLKSGLGWISLNSKYVKRI
jgi:N-acetylmuramoyl-L-alanine amidase